LERIRSAGKMANWYQNTQRYYIKMKRAQFISILEQIKGLFNKTGFLWLLNNAQKPELFLLNSISERGFNLAYCF